MSSELKAIETRYKGYRFRSRLEARWAVFFDAINAAWNYEPEGYMLDSGLYLPDFLVTKERKTLRSTWVEVKPCEPSQDDTSKSKELSLKSGVPLLILIDDPQNGYALGFSPLQPRSHLWVGDPRGIIFELLGYDVGGGEADMAVNAFRSARFEHGESGAAS